MKHIGALACSLLVFGGSMAMSGTMPQEGESGIYLLKEQNMREIEDYINQKDENEAAKEQSKRGDQAKKPLLPIIEAKQ